MRKNIEDDPLLGIETYPGKVVYRENSKTGYTDNLTTFGANVMINDAC